MLPKQNRGSKAGNSRIHLADWAAVAVLVFEIPSFLLSQYRANSLHTAQSVGLAVLAYFLVRLTVSSPVRVTVTAVAIAISGVVAASITAYQFFSDSERLKELGFTQLIAFRSRLVHPLFGWVPGEWFTFLLLTLPFACSVPIYLYKAYPNRGKLSTAFAVLPAILIVCSLTLSLSRAVFWSTVIFVIVGCGLMALYRIASFKGMLVLLAACAAVLITVLSVTTMLYPQMLTAYAGGHTSQLRSTRGRMEIWRRSADIARAYPLFGVGSSNSALFLLSTADYEDTTGFASRPFSLPVQLLTEKGVVGIGLYAAFVVLLGIEFHRGMRSSREPKTKSGDKKRDYDRKQQRHQRRLAAATAHRGMNCCFAAGIVAVLFRELTYSSLLEHPLTLVLFTTVAALVCRTQELAA